MQSPRMCEWSSFCSKYSMCNQIPRAQLLLAPIEVGGSRPVLSSGLYIVAVGPADSNEERHYVIYWPEDSTWDDSATPSVSRNRVTFMR
jgi:hypothetical protein